MKQLRIQERRAREAALSEALAKAGGAGDRCGLCGRPMVAGDSLNVHHLVPRLFGGRATAVIHRVCHAKIHAVFTEAELARHYHTFPRLRAHAEIQRFVKWVRRQAPESNARHARPRR